LVIVAATSVRLVGVTLGIALVSWLLVGARGKPARLRARHAAVVFAVLCVALGAWFARDALVTHRLPANLLEAVTPQNGVLRADLYSPHPRRATAAELAKRVAMNLRAYGYLVADVLTGKRVEAPWFAAVG